MKYFTNISIINIERDYKGSEMEKINKERQENKIKKSMINTGWEFYKGIYYKTKVFETEGVSNRKERLLCTETEIL